MAPRTDFPVAVLFQDSNSDGAASEDEEEDSEGGNDEDSDGESGGWITPRNIQRVRQELGQCTIPQDVRVGCVTTDFAMQVRGWAQSSDPRCQRGWDTQAGEFPKRLS